METVTITAPRDPVSVISRNLVSRAGRRDNIVVGPLVWYPADETHKGATLDDRIWTVVVTVPRASGFHIISVALGIAACEPDDAIAEACDTVIVLRRANELTHDEARAERARLVEVLSKKFRNLHDAVDELDAARALARIWPCERAQRLLRAVTAERAAA
jgi:hypothetical protein